MIKLSASKKWFLDAASKEESAENMSAGSSFLVSNKSQDVVELKDLSEIRRNEGFSNLLRMLRLNAGLSYEKLAKKINANIEELILIERQAGYRASPRTLVSLANFYKIPTSKLLQIGGAVKNIDEKLNDEVIRFAAESESFDKLTKEEKKLLQKIVKAIGGK